jgi:hypothetical protein
MATPSLLVIPVAHSMHFPIVGHPGCEARHRHDMDVKEYRGSPRTTALMASFLGMRLFERESVKDL